MREIKFVKKPIRLSYSWVITIPKQLIENQTIDINKEYEITIKNKPKKIILPLFCLN